MTELRITNLSDLSERQTVSFKFLRKGRKVQAFVTRFNGEIVAYENVCRHMPVSLDYGDERFYTRDGRHLICQTHGAIYEPVSGLCIRGPCEGDSLKKVQIEIRDDAVWLVEK